MRSKIYFLITLTVMFMTGCSKDFLDTKPLTEFSDVDVWKDPALVETFINQIYWRLDEPASNGRLKSNIVDEAHYRGNGASLNFNKSLLTVDQIPGWSTPSRYRAWNDIYKTIRYCNLFFANVDKVPFDNTIVDGKSQKDRMMGEVYFLRAYLYHELTSVYGGVPIIKNAYTLTDEFNIARNTYEECVSFMVEDLDLAAGLLPTVQSGNNKGRATKGAAMALKSRVLLYAASDLYNTTVFPGYDHPELIGYVGGSRTARWTAAKNAAKDVMDLGIYSLFKATPAPGDSVAKNLADLFIAKDTEEDIFIKYFTSNQQQLLGLVSGPNGWHNWGTNAPLSDMVDDYEMKDGTKFSWTNPEHAAAPYKNREPRFYASILYEGAVWKKRPADVERIDPVGVIQVGTWQKWDAASGTMKLSYGLDTRKSVIEDWNGGYPGYYLRKFQDPAVDAQYFYQTVPWRWIRYGEVLLNYAEACIELGQDDEAKLYLNQIRKRAGMPPITETGAALKQRYRHERRIELAFEEQRFFDVRRWVIGPQAYHPVKYVEVIYKMNPDHTTATVPTITPKTLETWVWQDKAYFFPILRDEMNKNNLLIQNPGY
ncbi:MAG TPA: RagB/SusD family nutrient uptake outer membrane protein [Bacteroidales bacterium]|nr:RagB/SusD family nutrient uptake outer membrane protein [Bacteroidales bacterium]